MKEIGLREIARLANTSIGTVDRALHGRKRISENTRKRVLEIAQSVGYRPNLAARALSIRRAPILIGVCIPREIHYYFDEVREGILAEAGRFKHLGVRTLYRPTDRLGYRELEKVSEIVERGPRAIIIVPGDPESVAPAINAAEEKNIRVICVDTDAPTSRRSSVVSLDGEVSGSLAAELMARFVNAGASVAVVTGMLHTEDHGKKTRIFSDFYPKFSQGGEVVEIVEAHDDEDEAFQKCTALLKSQSNLAGLYVSTGNCLPVCRAVCALGLSGKIRLVTSDLFKEMIPYFEKGVIFASIYGRPYVQGEIAMRLAVDHIVDGRPLPPYWSLAPQLVMRSNLHLFRETRPQKGVANGEFQPASESLERVTPGR